MALRATIDRESFLEQLEARYATHRARCARYDEALYRTTFLPEPGLFELILDLHEHRNDAGASAMTIPNDETRAALRAVLIEMTWPDVDPLPAVAALLPDWDSLHVTTLLHLEIPDYPIYGAEECEGLERLGIDCNYEAQPVRARSAYGGYLDAVATLRGAAQARHVPELHHYLTRITQGALFELGVEP